MKNVLFFLTPKAMCTYLYDDYKYTSELEKIQELTSAKNIGIWNEEEKNKYNNENNITEDIEDEEENNTTEQTTKNNSNNYSIKDIIIIGVLLLIIVFVGDRSIKNKAKKKLKKYLK